MSGIEIAGLVMGALPLFIAAAEAYRDGLNFAERALRKRAFIAQYRTELVEQKALLGLYIKAVVGRTSLLPATQAALVETINGPAWAQPEVVQGLRKELEDAYSPFIGALAKICTTLARQMREIEADRDGMTEQDLITRLEELCIDASKRDAAGLGKDDIFNKLKFSWKRQERDKLLTDLKECNTILQRLGIASNDAKPYEHKQEMRRIHATFKLRDEAERLHRAMSKACVCQPCKQQKLALGLAVHHYPGRSTTDVQFHIFLFDSKNDVCATSVKMLKAVDEPPTKRLKTAMMPKQNKQLKRVKDICEANRMAKQRSSRLELILDENGDLYTAGDQPNSSTAKPVDCMLTLTEVMDKFQIYDHKRWLHKEKAILAVVLAHSLPQVHESSWWQSLWDANSISFLGADPSQVTSSSDPDQRIQLRRPFTMSNVAQAQRSSALSNSKPHRNAHLHALGIVLLEIYLNQPISILAAGNADFRSVASNLLDEHSDDITMTSEFLCATRFCLHPSPNPTSGSFSFHDKGFREMFYEHVILELETHLASVFKVDSSIWIE